MEKKQRLIDTKAFDWRVSQKSMLDVFPNWKELPKEVHDAVCKHGQYLRAMLETQPTVDAVEVVWCKDCLKQEIGWCHFHARCVEEYDFCSYGERREDNG